MSSETITRAHLTEAIHNQVGLSRADSAQLVESVLDEMSKTLETGQSVKISSFASFILRDKSKRVGRNPRTGIEATITPRRVVLFRPSQLLRKKINAKIK